MKKYKIVTGLLLLVGFWLWTMLVWNEPNQLNSDSRPQTESLNSSLIEYPFSLYALYSETEGVTEKRMTSPQIHLNEAQSTQKTVQTALKKRREVETYNVIVIDDCEYMKNLNGPPPAANTNYVHKGNCTNPIHPENTVDWVKMNKLLNSPMLKNILN